jgi:hypothetical protein
MAARGTHRRDRGANTEASAALQQLRMCCPRGLSDAALSALEGRARKQQASGDQAGGHQH